MFDPRIRTAQAADIPAMLDVQRSAMMELAAASYDPVQISALLRYNARQFERLVRDGRSIVVTSEARIIGCAGWQPSGSDARGQKLFDGVEVRSVYVHPNFARRGLARLLLLQIERKAREFGASELTLLATFNAVQFYCSQGYIVKGSGELQASSISLPGKSMKSGIIRSGNMGRAIGVRLSHAGHDVAFRPRHTAKAVDAIKRASSSATAVSVDEAARFGDVLIWPPKEPDPGEVIVDVNNRDYQNVRDGVWFAESLTE
ncbi:MAG: GNAT family N-acetyltransferase [Parvularcula sp.]|jgi:N-acetylglutamate synthase-like GNAT family acetyltransferase|nr:GNAT family N-acetyltransferase [Parvularcula sp.]